MNRETGRQLSGIAHIRQSVAEILMTPKGSRVMRRDFGSDLPDLIDRPWSNVLALQLMAATVMAVKRWEPRLRIAKVGVLPPGLGGGAVLSLEGWAESQPVTLEVPLP